MLKSPKNQSLSEQMKCVRMLKARQCRGSFPKYLHFLRLIIDHQPSNRIKSGTQVAVVVSVQTDPGSRLQTMFATAINVYSAN